MEEKITVRLGTMAPQVTDQFPELPTSFNDDNDALSRLYIRGILTACEITRARHRLSKKIFKELEELKTGTAP